MPDSENIDASREKFVKHSTLYFDDGDIVLAVQRPRKTRSFLLFRVDKIFLSRYSKTFSDMLTMPASPEGREQYEGAPIVRLVGDDPKAVEVLIQYMYNPASLSFDHFQPESPNCMNAVRAMRILKVARKYQVDSIHQFLERQIEDDWPTNCIDWLRRRKDEEAVEAPGRIVDNVECSMIESYPEPASAIKLGIEYGMRSILPAAFYCLAQTHYEREWDQDYNDVDPWPYTPHEQLPYDAYPDLNSRRIARWSMVSREVYYCLYLGKQRLSKYIPHMRRFLEEHIVVDGCTRYKKCAVEGDLIDSMITHGRDEDSMDIPMYPDPLDKLIRVGEKVQESKLCNFCKNNALHALQEATEKLWRELPEIFQIDTLLAEHAT